MQWISGESGTRYKVEDSAFTSTSHARLHRCRDEAGASFVYKIYAEPLDSQDEIGRLTELISRGRYADPTQPGYDAVGWLVDAVVEKHAVVGVVLRAAPSGFLNFGRDPRTFHRLYTPASYSPGAEVRIKVLLSVCELFACLEREGLAHGRVSADKLLWRSDTAPHAYLLGCDSLRPATADGGALEDDRRALADLIYRGLLLTDSGQSVPPELDERIRALFHRAFASQGASGESRPGPAEWRDALSAVTAADIDRLTASLQPDDDDITENDDYEYDHIADEPETSGGISIEYRVNGDATQLFDDADHEDPSFYAPGFHTDPSRRRLILTGVGLVAVIAIFIAIAVHSSHTSAPPAYTYSDPYSDPQPTTYATDPGTTSDQPTDQATDQATDTQNADGEQQAQAVYDLINASSSDRTLVDQAVQSEVGTCSDPSQGLTDLRQAATDRARELASAQQLDVSQIDNGQQLLSDLVSALTYSSEADQAYADWAVDVENEGCNGAAPPDDSFNSGDGYSKQAETAKSAFLQDWQSVAAQYSLPTPAPDSF